MASSQPEKGRSSGVRGPRGPHATPRTPGSQAAAKAGQSGGKRGWRVRLEEVSLPFLSRLGRIPRWLIVVLPAVLLLLGLIQTGSLAWLGGILLLLVFVIVAWLTALSWPVIQPGSRVIRLVVLAALGGLVILKFAGRF